MKEKKILDVFCKKLVAQDMDIFGTRKAQDAEPTHKTDWITMNGTHVFVGEGETPESAGKKFAAKKEAEHGLQDALRKKAKSQSKELREKSKDVHEQYKNNKWENADNTVKMFKAANNGDFDFDNPAARGTLRRFLERNKYSDDDIAEYIASHVTKPLISTEQYMNAKKNTDDVVKMIEATGHKMNFNDPQDRHFFRRAMRRRNVPDDAIDMVIAHKKSLMRQPTLVRGQQNNTASNQVASPKKTSLKDLEVKLSKKSAPLSKKEQSIHNSMMDLIHEQHQYETNRRDYLDAQKTMKQLENTYRGKFTPEYQKAKQKADAALTKYSFALDKFRTLRTKFQKEHGIEITDKI